MKKEKIYLISTIILALGILIFSLVKVIFFNLGRLTLMTSGFVTHFVAYFLLSSCFALYLKEKKVSNYILIAIISASMYGVTMECLQYFTPYRFMDYKDMIVNAIGSSLAIITKKL